MSFKMDRFIPDRRVIEHRMHSFDIQQPKTEYQYELVSSLFPQHSQSFLQHRPVVTPQWHAPSWEIGKKIKVLEGAVEWNDFYRRPLDWGHGLMCVANREGEGKVWHMQKPLQHKQSPEVFASLPFEAVYLKSSFDDTELAIGGIDAQLTVMDIQAKKVIETLSVQATVGAVSAIAWNPHQLQGLTGGTYGVRLPTTTEEP